MPVARNNAPQWKIIIKGFWSTEISVCCLRKCWFCTRIKSNNKCSTYYKTCSMPYHSLCFFITACAKMKTCFSVQTLRPIIVYPSSSIYGWQQETFRYFILIIKFFLTSIAFLSQLLRPVIIPNRSFSLYFPWKLIPGCQPWKPCQLLTWSDWII